MIHTQTHADAADFLALLLCDLRLQLGGLPPVELITAQRLDEAMAYVAEIRQCLRQTNVYRTDASPMRQ